MYYNTLIWWKIQLIDFDIQEFKLNKTYMQLSVEQYLNDNLNTEDFYF